MLYIIGLVAENKFWINKCEYCAYMKKQILIHWGNGNIPHDKYFQSELTYMIQISNTQT